MSASDGRVVSNFVSQAVLGQPLSLYGEGSATRCFCYVDDMVTGILSAATARDFHGPVNLGSENEISVLQLADLIAGLVPHDTGRTYHPAPEDDPTRRRPDLSLAREILAWAPKVGLEQGLADTISWMGSSQ